MAAANQSLLQVKDVLIAIPAFVGMGLGLYNLWNEKKKQKVILKVVPKAVIDKVKTRAGKEMVVTSENGFDIKRSHGLFGIEVVKLSAFPVVVDKVGFLVKGEKNRMVLPVPIIGDAGSWPRQLDARSSVTVYGDVKEMLSSPSLPKVRSAFAETSCGHIGTGSTQALKQLIESSPNGQKHRSFLASLFGFRYGPR